MPEEWRPVFGYEGLYSVSSKGRVRSEERVIVSRPGKLRSWTGRRKPRLMRPSLNGWGYLQVNLTKDGRKRTFAVHALVARAFLGPRPCGAVVLHGPMGQKNNEVENLSYGSQAQNIGPDRARDGTLLKGEEHGRAKLREWQVREIRASDASHASLARSFGVSSTAVRLIRLGKNWKDLDREHDEVLLTC